MDTLFLHPEPQGHFTAWGREVGTIQPLGSDSLSVLAARYAGARVVLFIPSSQCLLTTVSLSAGQRKQLAGNFAWLIEEQVGVDVETLHIIAGPEQANGQTPVLAIAIDVLEAWRTTCREVGWALHAIVPDVLLLCLADDKSWALDVNGPQLTLRTGMLSGAVLESLTPAQVLRAAWQDEANSPPERLVISGEVGAYQAEIIAWADSHQMVIEHQSDPDIANALLTVTDWSRHPGNFLQGQFAMQRQVLLPSAIRIAAIFLLVAFAVQLVSEWGRYAYFHHHATQAQSQATTLYKQLFPNDRRIVSIRRQMEAHLEQGAASGGALIRMTQLAEAMQGSGLDTQRIDFSGGIFTLDVDARSITDIDALKQRLSGMGLQAEIISANAQNGMIRGRLRIGAGT